MKVSYENWKSVFNNSDINISFNAYFSTYTWDISIYLFLWDKGKSINWIHG
jgi:hypothetical protein